MPADRALPSGVFGPRLRRPFARLAVLDRRTPVLKQRVTVETPRGRGALTG
jgi:hypothetical protein